MRRPRGPARGRVRALRNDRGCLLWQLAIDSNGYGVDTLTGTGRKIGAHVHAWIRKHGPVPRGLKVLHRCDVRHCIEETHLFLGTAKRNYDDALAKGRIRRVRGEWAGLEHP